MKSPWTQKVWRLHPTHEGEEKAHKITAWDYCDSRVQAPFHLCSILSADIDAELDRLYKKGRKIMTDNDIHETVEQCFRAVGVRSSTVPLWVSVRTFLSQLDRHGYEIRRKKKTKAKKP